MRPNKQREERIEELRAKIPQGTICTENNNCGGYLTVEEAVEFERLLTWDCPSKKNQRALKVNSAGSRSN